MIQVTKTFLPPWEEYLSILRRAWDTGWITNNGTLLLELESRLKKQTGTENLFICNNGTIVLQMALKALGISGEVITTPFSYVATTNAILWENCIPVFADISEKDFNADPEKIEALITPNTKAIMLTHVYGNPCDVERIEKISLKHNLPVIYDGAHCFGVKYKNKDLLSYGDISTCSFHATKLFHMVEGGLITCRNEEVARKLMLFRQFGHVYDDYYSVGINAKSSEFHAAMGLAVLPYVNNIIQDRKKTFENYMQLLSSSGLKFPSAREGTIHNFGYFPVVFESEQQMLSVKETLAENGVNIRRYFYPSLNKLPFIRNGQPCPVSEIISSRVACLPLYYQLAKSDVDKICEIICQEISSTC
jgi:dTDP-4-amino-4,6-dideoxygalactose transaminase